MKTLRPTAAFTVAASLAAATALGQQPGVMDRIRANKAKTEAPAPAPAAETASPAPAPSAGGAKPLPSELAKQGLQSAAPAAVPVEGAAPASVAPAETVAEEPAAPSQIPEETDRVGLPMRGQRGGGEVKINLGKESEEKAKGGVTDIFKNPTVLKLLGINPSFIYDSENVPDPMIYPPVAREAIRNELWAKSEKLVTESGVDLLNPKLSVNVNKDKIKEAIEALKQINELNDDRFKNETHQKLAALAPYLEGTVVVDPLNPKEKPPDDEPPALSPEFKSSIGGVISGGPEPICLIADEMLKVGESPSKGEYSHIKVLEIHPDKLVLEVSNDNVVGHQSHKTRREEIPVGDFSNIDFWNNRRGR